MREIPREPVPDSTLALLRQPYDFIGERCRRHQSDVFATCLLLRDAICMSGADAAELICDVERFERRGAMPDWITKTLIGKGGVQSLDNTAHRLRKEMFLSLMTPERVAALSDLVDAEWASAADRWHSLERVVLYDELRIMLTRAVSAWSGISLPTDDAERRAGQLTALFEHAGSIGPKHWWARLARRQAERWAARLVRGVRAGALSPPEGSALRVIASHGDADGRPLSERVAAVELLNILRPTVAVAVFITFVAVALTTYPAVRARLRAGEPGYAELVVQEVRRFYPFFPSIAARTRRAFEWKGYRFPAGRRTVLDLYGTDHDPRSWADPDAFHPERFLEWDGSPFNFIPQGPGDHARNHRCPGEPITIALMRQAADWLAARLDYQIPPQDLTIDRSKLPPLPPSRLVMTHVRRAYAAPH